MARFTESFDSYATASPTSSQVGIFSRWQTTNTGSYGLVAGRYGGQALQVGNSGDAHRRIWTALGFTTNKFRLSIAARFTSAVGRDGVHIGLGQAGSVQVAIKFMSDTGKFYLVRGGTESSNGVTLAESSKSYSNRVFRTLRLKGLIHPSAGELSLIVDNEAPEIFTGLNTQALGTSDITHAILMSRASSGSSGGTNGTYDDLVIEDTDSSHLPECRIQQLLPNSDGAHLDLTPSTGSSHYAVVDEPTVSVTDYLSGDTAGQYDLLGCQDLSVIPASVLGVKAVGFAAKTGAASRSWNLGFVSDSTTEDGDDLSLTSDPQYYENDFPVDPDTDAEWTQSGINAIQLKPMVAV